MTTPVHPLQPCSSTCRDPEPSTPRTEQHYPRRSTPPPSIHKSLHLTLTSHDSEATRPISYFTHYSALHPALGPPIALAGRGTTGGLGARGAAGGPNNPLGLHNFVRGLVSVGR